MDIPKISENRNCPSCILKIMLAVIIAITVCFLIFCITLALITGGFATDNNSDKKKPTTS